MVERPRPFIGFSDNTAIHLALNARGVGSFHAPHPGSAFPPFSRDCFRATLFDGVTGPLPLPAGCSPRCLVPGTCSGRLIGGNLALLAALAGTPWALRARDGIVLIEDVGEATYRIDRALTQLILSGAFEGVRGFAIGQFTERPAVSNDRDVHEVVTELLGPFGVPILAELPFGHIDEQWSLSLGANARVDASGGIVELLEAGVA
jgi:muramoyltetrapeptide carboxypeptidase